MRIALFKKARERSIANINMPNVLYSILKRNWRLILKYITIILLIGGCSLAVPILSGLFIDHIASNFENIIFIKFVAAIAVTNLIHMLFRYLRTLIATRLERTLTFSVSNSIFQKIFNADCRVFTNTDNAFLIDQISKDSNAVVKFFLSNVIEFFVQSITIIFSSAFIYQVDKLLSFIIFSLIPLYVLTFLKCKNQMHTAKKEYKEGVNEYFSKYSEQINKLNFIRRNSLAPEMGLRLYSAFKAMLYSSIKTIKTDYIFANINQFFVVLAYICITAIGGYRVGMQMLSLGFFTAINTYFNMLIHSISYFLNLANTYQDAIISLERIKRILHLPNASTGTLRANKVMNIIIQDLQIEYDKKVILNKCHFCFEKGKIYGIVGHNGCGKSTFLNTLIGLCMGEYSGKILYSGMDINLLDMNTLRREIISYLEQEPVMLNMPVDEYLSLGIDNTADSEKKQAALLEMFDVKYLMHRQINENGSNLSGGEKKKLCLARVLSKNSQVLILDEPTSALDNDSIQKLSDYLKAQKRDYVTIIVSHDSHILQACDHIIELHEGHFTDVPFHEGPVVTSAPSIKCNQKSEI